MEKMAGNFMKAAVIYALAGFGAGIVMGASHDFTLKPAHSHLNLIGWLTMAVYAAFYQLVPSAALMKAAKAHFILANIGTIIMTISLARVSTGSPVAEAGAAVGSMVTFVALLAFAYVVFASPRKAEA